MSNKVFFHGMGNGVRKGCTRMRNLGRKSSPFWSASFISHPFFMRLSRRPIVAVLKEIDIRWQAVSSSENENLQCSWKFVGKRDWNWGFPMWRLPNQLILLFSTCILLLALPNVQIRVHSQMGHTWIKHEEGLTWQVSQKMWRVL